jgi:sporulation protein YlmC with PRC-barrel domain
VTSSTTTVEYPLALRLLDHQIDGPDGSAVANVDDIELEVHERRIIATALLCGPGALGERLPGRIGRWTLAAWRRLSLEQPSAPIRIPLTEVQRIGSAIILTPEASRAVQQRLTLETWLRVHLIERLPGSGAEAPSIAEPRLRRAPDVALPARRTHKLLLSHLLTYEALRGSDSVGTVHEVTAVTRTPRAPVIGQLEVSGFVIGPRATGSSLGYDRHPEHGPSLVRAVVGALHRHDLHVSVADLLEIDHVHATISLRT